MNYDKLKMLCKKQGITVKAVTEELGLAKNSGTRWKNGQEPNAQTAKMLADRLNVSVDYLLSDTDDVHYRPLTENEVTLLEIFKSVDEKLQQRVIGRMEMLVMEGLIDYVSIAHKLHKAGIAESEIDSFILSHTKK